nr:RecName: Full=Periviscerokinin-2 type 2; Short=PVK-2 type 2 [Celatoblatta sp. Blue Mountains]
GSSGLISVPRV